MTEEWKKELWYGPDGMYQAEIKRDEQGNPVEVKNIVKEKRSEVAHPTISIYAAMFFPYTTKNKEHSGKLILHRRPASVSFPGDWELLGGGISAEANEHADDERIIGKELNRIISEKTNFAWKIEIEHMPPMHPVIIKGGSDWAFIIPVITNELGIAIFGEDDFMLASPEELLTLANGPEGNRLLSGYGKRMHRLALMAFRYSPNKEYKKESKKMRKPFYAHW
jgi:hypothetical protein